MRCQRPLAPMSARTESLDWQESPMHSGVTPSSSQNWATLSWQFLKKKKLHPRVQVFHLTKQANKITRVDENIAYGGWVRAIVDYGRTQGSAVPRNTLVLNLAFLVWLIASLTGCSHLQSKTLPLRLLPNEMKWWTPSSSEEPKVSRLSAGPWNTGL